MAPPKGNKFWKARSSHGRKKLFTDPEILYKACQEYFQWCEDNPLWAAETVKFQGAATIVKVPKLRAMTISGLCLFLGIDPTTWREYRLNKDFSTIIRKVEQTIRTQKFEGASADLLNANIIARDLGLADKQQHTGKDDGPIETKSTLEAGPGLQGVLDALRKATSE